MSTEAKEEWGWMGVNEEHANGVFDSRAAAIEDAKKHPSEYDVVDVGRVVRARPAKCLPSADDIIEQMNELAYDNGFGWVDDAVFDISDAGEGALEDALKAWAEAYVSSDYWTLDETERVELKRKAPKRK